MTHVIVIDIASESFVAHLIACQPTVAAVGEITSFENSTEGFTKCQCLSWLLTSELHPEETLIVVEATGIYWGGSLRSWRLKHNRKERPRTAKGTSHGITKIHFGDSF